MIQCCFPVQLIFAAFYGALLVDLSGHYGQDRTYDMFEPRFDFKE